MTGENFRIYAGFIALLLVGLSLYARYQIQRHEKINEHEAWKYDRHRELRSVHTSWLNLAGLFWLEDEKAYSFGYGSDSDFQIDEGTGPDRIGSFVRTAEEVYFEPTDGAAIMHGEAPLEGRILLVADPGEDGSPTYLTHGSLTWWLIERDGKIGVRVRDTERKAWKAYTGVDAYDFDFAYQLPVQFIPYDEPQEFTYPTVIGTMRTEVSPGLLIYQYEGKQYEMVPFERNDGERLFLVFGDKTSGVSTYGGGRFLYVHKREDGSMVIDFNKAYNPPCAFTKFSTCPQPLARNKLPFSVEAGEKVYVY